MALCQVTPDSSRSMEVCLGIGRLELKPMFHVLMWMGVRLQCHVLGSVLSRGLRCALPIDEGWRSGRVPWESDESVYPKCPWTESFQDNGISGNSPQYNFYYQKSSRRRFKVLTGRQNSWITLCSAVVPQPHCGHWSTLDPAQIAFQRCWA